MSKGAMLVVSAVLIGIYVGLMGAYSHYEYNRDILSYWELADRSSTLSEKYKYINKFVGALQSCKHSDYDAVFFKTPKLSFDDNMGALISLRDRLDAIKDMPTDSFQYQTAIEQITKQEQGQAGEMLSVFSGAWYLANYWYLWDWIPVLIAILLSGMIIVGVAMSGWFDA